MKKIILLISFVFVMINAKAHPMPGSTVELTIMETYIKGEAIIPLMELGNAVGDSNILNLQHPFLKKYFTDHIRASNNGKYWVTLIEDIELNNLQDAIVGEYKTAVIHFTLTPENKRFLRKFTFNYDAVIHQVVTHSAIISIKQDWNNGVLPDENKQEIGIIKMDVPSGKIIPLEVNLEEGSRWKGFQKIFNLGMTHIKAGTDHLLFLLVLLLPSMLILQGKKWGKSDSLKKSLTRLISIVTAFTIGHSITLIIGALHLLKLPQQPVEIIIALSILISAIHAVYPIFPGKELYIASGFGLIHGLAFATILSNLTLETSTLTLSILGFNLGIEIMQLFIIGLIIPWLLLLSKTPFYNLFKLILSFVAGIAATAWIAERITGSSNPIAEIMLPLPENGIWVIGSLATISLFGYFLHRFSDRAI